MFEVTVKFETEADKESFISSVLSSFNSTGKDKSVHANHVERVGQTIFFTKQPDEVISPKASEDSEDDSSDVSDLIATASLIDTAIDETTGNDPAPTVETSETVGSDGGGDFGGGGAGGSFDYSSDSSDTSSEASE